MASLPLCEKLQGRPLDISGFSCTVGTILDMAEAENSIEVAGTTSVRGEPRRVYITRGQPGRIVLTVYAGKKPVDVVIPIRELNEAIRRLDDSV
jgi:hypothetical protein